MGRNLNMKDLPKDLLRFLMQDNMHLMNFFDYSETNEFPILKPYQSKDLLPEVFSYKERRRHTANPWAVHFFAEDYTIIHSVTDKLEKTTSEISGCDLVFAPDISLYADLPNLQNKYNIFRSRLAAAYWQHCGLNVIQTASWANADSLKYCFEGLAEKSDTAVCGVGHNRNRQMKRLWDYALEKLTEEKSPTKLFIYGDPEEKLPDLGIPVVFIQDFITKRLRKL